jgi:cell division protease FtsH
VYKRQLQILTENQAQLTELAEQLLATEVIFKEDLERIFGKRQWESDELVEEKVLVENVTETEDVIAVEESVAENTVEENSSANESKEEPKEDSIEETETK